MNDDSLIFKVPAMRILQREEKNTAIYLTKIKVSDFSTRTSERFSIDYFKRENRTDKGYQRQLALSSVEKIKKFVLQESAHPILPTSILANSRQPLKFKELNHSDLGELEITDRLYIIDGQHRFEAWKSLMLDDVLREEWKDYEIPVVILSGFDRVKEIEQFYVINSRQKRIKTDLAQRMLLEFAKHDETKGLISPKDDWIKFAVVITDSLNEEKENIWKGRIVIEGDSADLKKTKLINQTSFVSSLKPFFIGSDRIFDIPNKNKPDECIDLLVKFWEIVARVYPLIVDHPFDYSLLKTVGAFSLHMFLNNIAKRNGGLENKEKILKEAQTALLKASDEENGNYKTDFWRSKVSPSVKERGGNAGSYSSSAGHTRLALGLENNLVF
jgi:DGQHR domain-containing protein